MELIDEVKNLCAFIAPSGAEQVIRNYIADRISCSVDTVKIDKVGNIIAKINGYGTNKVKIGFIAHMDSAGFIVTNITDNGYILFGSLSSWKPEFLLGQKVCFTNGTHGLIECKSKEFAVTSGIEQLYIDINACNRQEAEKLVRIGDMAALMPQFSNDGKIISGTFLDNRVGCACIMHLAQIISKPENDIYFIFCIQEEIGGKGSSIIANENDFDVIINIDATVAKTWNNSEVIPVSISNGPAFKISDGSVISSHGFLEFFEKLASELGLNLQREAIDFSGSDAGSFAKYSRGTSIAGISIPCKYMHTTCETMNISDIKSVVCLLEKFVEKYKNDYIRV